MSYWSNENWRYSDSCMVPGVRRHWRMGNGYIWRINPVAGGGYTVTRHRMGEDVQVIARFTSVIRAMVAVGLMINETA